MLGANLNQQGRSCSKFIPLNSCIVRDAMGHIHDERPTKRLQGRREQDQKRKITKSVDAYSRGTNLRKLSNGNIAAFACGPLKRERYINPRMEVELVNFKAELEKRFKKSAIQGFIFPRTQSYSISSHSSHRDIRLPRDRAYNLPEIRQSSSKNFDRSSDHSSSKTSATHRVMPNQNYVEYENNSRQL